MDFNPDQRQHGGFRRARTPSSLEIGSRPRQRFNWFSDWDIDVPILLLHQADFHPNESNLGEKEERGRPLDPIKESISQGSSGGSIPSDGNWSSVPTVTPARPRSFAYLLRGHVVQHFLTIQRTTTADCILHCCLPIFLPSSLSL